MIKGLHKNLYILEALVCLYRHSTNISARFKLSTENPYSDVIRNQYSPITDKNSKIKVKPLDLAPYHYLGFGFFDETDTLLTVFNTGDAIKDNTMYPDWAYMAANSNKYFLFNKETGDKIAITSDLGEDEHFQMMMEMTVPDFMDMQNLWEYMGDTKAALDTHNFSHSIDYSKLDIDLSDVDFSSEVIVSICDEISKRRNVSENKAYNMLMDTLQNNPESSFKYTYMVET